MYWQPRVRLRRFLPCRWRQEGCRSVRFDGDFAEFYSARFETACRTAYALCGNWAEAEEIAQQGFVRLYARWPAVAQGHPDAYLRTVLTRLFLDSKRRGRGRESWWQTVPSTPCPPIWPVSRSRDRC